MTRQTPSEISLCKPWRCWASLTMVASRHNLLDLSCEICWRQWTALGVSGVKKPESRSVIDLEALIVFTAGLGDADPRLRDEATDWCVQFGPRFVSASRLRNFLSAEPADARPPLLEFIATVNDHSTARWPIPDVAKPRAVKVSGKSRLPSFRKRPELVRLQLRALFGNTARAEVLLAFIASRPSPEPFLSASDLVATGYSKRNVAFVLADLAQGGLLTERKFGNQLRYRLEQRAELAKLVPGSQGAILTRWDLRFRTLAAACRLFTATRSKSLTIQSIEARRFVTDLSDTWHVLDLTPPAPEEPTRYGADLATWIDQTLVPQQLR
jgi:hypothetical protein